MKQHSIFLNWTSCFMQSTCSQKLNINLVVLWTKHWAISLGISLDRWKYNQNTHQVLTNSMDHDPDIFPSSPSRTRSSRPSTRRSSGPSMLPQSSLVRLENLSISVAVFLRKILWKFSISLPKMAQFGFPPGKKFISPSNFPPLNSQKSFSPL